MIKEGIVLSKGGKLFKTDWLYNEKTEEGELVTFDATDIAPRLLFETVSFDDDVTLRDIFRLLNRHIDILEPLLGNWCRELTAEALSGIGPAYSNKYDAEGIEYLELTHSFGENTWDGHTESFGNIYPDFGGKGFMLKEDATHGDHTGPEGVTIGHEAGSRISWGLELSSPNTLINIPIKLNPNTEIYHTDLSEERTIKSDKVATLNNLGFSLGQILYGIVWELTFNGPPEVRDDLKAELTGQVKEITGEVEKPKGSHLSVVRNGEEKT
jgi:hypothetical protein